jgi:hypothetical protein
VKHRTIITDIDGTILEKGVPVGSVIDYIKAGRLPIHILTNRPEASREVTINDLNATGINYEALIMNDTGEPPSVFKKAAVEKMISAGMSPVEFIDDSKANRNAVKSLGVCVKDPADIIAASQIGDAPVAHSLDSRVGLTSQTMTLEESLKALKAAFTNKSGEAEALSKEMSDLKAKNDSLAAALDAANEKFEIANALVARHDAALAEIENLKKSLDASEALKVEAARQIESVGKASAKIVASVGVQPVEISAADAATVSKTPEEVWNEYLQIKDPAQKVAFYNKNRPAIVSHLGVK